MISPLGPVSMKRGVWKPVAYSSISNPCGTCNCAPSGRATTLGPLSADGVAKGAGNFASCCCTCAGSPRAVARIAAREYVCFGIAFNFSVQEGVGYNLARRLVAAMSTRLLIAFLLTMTALWAQPDKTAWDLLNKGMLEKSVEKRRLAIGAIASIGLDAEAVRLLELALHGQDASIRQMAAAGLGELKANKSIPSLKTALQVYL